MIATMLSTATSAMRTISCLLKPKNNSIGASTADRSANCMEIISTRSPRFSL